MLTTETYDMYAERDRLDSELDDLAERSLDLQDRADELQGQSAELDDGDPRLQKVQAKFGRLMEEQEDLQQEISETSSHLGGVEWVIEEYGGGGGDTGGDTDSDGGDHEDAADTGADDEPNIPDSVEPEDGAPMTDGGHDLTITVGGLNAGEYAQVTDKVGEAQSEQMGFGRQQSSVEGASRIFYCASGLVDAPFLDGDGRNMGFDTKAEAVREVAPGLLGWLESKITALTTPSEAAGNGFERRVERIREQREGT